MGLRHLLATGLWVAATLASTALVWTATSIVAAEVTERPASVVAHEEVVSELESAAPAAPAVGMAPSTTTTTGPPRANGTMSTVPAVGRAPAAVTPSGPVPGGPPAGAPQVGVPAAPSPVPSTPAVTAPGAPPPARPGPPGSLPASRPTATYSTSGGVVRVTCNGLTIHLVSAIPANGYEVNVMAAGPDNVDVRFVGSGPEQSVKVICAGEPIRYYGQAPPRRPGPP